jgi:hypothetical protein
VLIMQTAMRETIGVTRSADRMRASPQQDRPRPRPSPRDAPPQSRAASCDFGWPSASLRHRKPAPVSHPRAHAEDRSLEISRTTTTFHTPEGVKFRLAGRVNFRLLFLTRVMLKKKGWQ